MVTRRRQCSKRASTSYLHRPQHGLTIRCAGDELDSRAPSGQGYNFDGVLHGLSEDDMDIMRLREENEVLMNTLVRSKLEMAETQSAFHDN